MLVFRKAVCRQAFEIQFARTLPGWRRKQRSMQAVLISKAIVMEDFFLLQRSASNAFAQAERAAIPGAVQKTPPPILSNFRSRCRVMER